MSKKLIVVFALLAFLWGCAEKEEVDGGKIQTYQLKGKVEKGPFARGSKVTLFELDNKFQPTGKSFNADVKTDEGDFEVGDIELKSPYVKIVADGYFYNEVEGDLSEGIISLSALADLTNKQSVNVNVLTHLKKDRILNMIKEGKSFNEANKQAQKELLTAFSLQNYASNDVADFSVAAGNDDAGVLIATSACLLDDRSEAQLTEHLSVMSEEFGSNGQFSDKVKSDLWNSSVSLDWTRIAEDLVRRYEGLGKQITVPDLTYYVDWDKNGVAGDELGDKNEEKKLVFGNDTLKIGKNGGTFNVSIDANLPYDFTFHSSGDVPPSDVVTEESIFSSEFKDMLYTKTLDKVNNQLKIEVQPAEGAFMRNSPVSIYSMDGKLTATVVLVQEGDMDKFAMSEKVMSYSLSVLQSLLNLSDVNYTMEAFYTQCYQASPSDWKWNKFNDHTVNADYGVLSTGWQQAYSTINRIYSFIEAFERQSDSSIYRDIYSNFSGIVYYQLALLWGNVPYVDQVSYLDVYRIPQLREQEVYEKIEQSFLRSYKFLPAKASDPNVYVSKYVPAAMLAKVYMQTGKYQQAYDLLQEIIKSGQYKLEPDKQSALADGSRELIYGLKLATSNGDYKNLIERNYSNLSIARYSEVLLMASECCLQFGNTSDAQKYLNEVRQNAGMSNITEVTVNSTLKETWKELLKGEFSYFAFLKRHDLCEQELGIKSYRKLLPIPIQEINKNPNLNQNPGY